MPNTVIRYPQLNESQRGGSKGHMYYSLVSIRKNAFLQDENIICSDNYLPSE